MRSLERTMKSGLHHPYAREEAGRVADELHEAVSHQLRMVMTEDLKAALGALRGEDWKGAEFVEVVLDDGPFSLSVRGARARFEGPAAFSDLTTESKPFFSHPGMTKIVELTEARLAQVEDASFRDAVASSLWWLVAIQVTAWVATFWRHTLPALRACLLINGGPGEQPVCDFRTGSWTSRFEFLSDVAAGR